jgi:hypothetical protein
MARKPGKTVSNKSRPTQKKAQVKKPKGRRGSVLVGLHGLSRVLGVIRRSKSLQAGFEKKLGSASVTLNKQTAAKIKSFVKNELPPDHPIIAAMSNCDCDPVTDPYCICF